LVNWIKNIVNHGVIIEDDFQERRKVQISNYLLIILWLYNLINFCVFGFIIWKPFLFWDAFFTLIYIIVFFFFRKKSFRNLLRHLVCIFILLGLANLSFRFGERAGFHFFIFFLGCIPFVLFENFKVIFAYFLAIVSVYLIFDVCFSSHPISPDPEINFLYYPNLIFSIFIFTSVTYNFKYQTNKYQKLVDNQVKDLSELSFKLMAQKDQVTITANQLRQKTSVLETQNKSIFESLRLASMVQREALPAVEAVFQGLKAGFLLYKPKDVVSGDFYWAKTTWQGTIIVVADCIGHGVPGSMMAVLAANLISQIVEDQGKIFPSDILAELDKKLRRRIKQDPDSEISDGMDIAIVLVADNQVSFAAASRPLVKISAEGRVQTFKGTRSQLASWKSNWPEFETLELEANRGDRFYLFTDGATDQFGEKIDKKLGTKQFIAELESLQSQSLDIQKEQLALFYDEWQGNQNQTDDIIILGFET